MVSTGYKLAQTITQSNGERFAKQYDSSFDNIDNLKKNQSWAICTLEASTGKYTYIPTLNLKNFGFNIPDTAKIDKINVMYYDKSSCTIQAPIISIPNINHAVSTGNTPSSTQAKTTVTFETDEMKLSQLDPADINDSEFGIELYWNMNQGAAGTYQIKNFWVEVIYTESSFSISAANIPTGVLYEEQTVDLEVTCTRNSGYSESNVQVLVEAPSGCEIIPNNSIKLVDGQYVWDVSFEFLNDSKTVTCSIKFTEPGDFTVKFTEKVNNASNGFSFHVESLKTLVQIVCPESMKIGDTGEVIVYNTYLETPYWDRVCTIEFPADFEVTVKSGVGSTTIQTSDTNTILSWTIPALTETAELYLSIMPTIATNSKILCYEQYGSLVNSKEILVLPSNYTVPFYGKYVVGSETTDLMGSSIVYFAVSYIRLEPTKDNVDEVYELYEDFRVNHRFGVFHDSGVDEDDDAEMINSCQFSDFLLLDDGWYKAEISFNYDGESPIVMYWTGDYLERDTSLVNVLFSTPLLIESQYYQRLSFKIPEYGNWPKPLKNLLTEGDYGSISLEKRKSASLFRTYDLDLEGIDELENFVFQGFTIYFDYECDNPCSVICSVFKNDLEGQRSTMIEKGTGTGKIGSSFDLFGLKYTDLEDASHLEMEFKIYNPYPSAVNLKIKNIRVDVAWSILDTPEWSEFWINGESSKYYECFLKDLTIVGGVETDVEIFHAEGNDIHIPYRQAIDVKEIEMEFYIESCEFANATQMFLRASRWFMNERDKYNRPILNTIEFEHIPDMKYEYLLEDGLEEEVLEGGNYEVKAKLTIPQGTMQSKNSIITGESGVNNSIARVSPTVQVSAIYQDITVRETTSGQIFKIQNGNISLDDILTIDCSERKVTLYKTASGQELDISASVDFDSDWFVLFSKEEYNFECDNGYFLSCEFYERW